MLSDKYDRSTSRTHTPVHLTAGDKLWGTTSLEGSRTEVIKQTYLLLGLSVSFAVAGGWVGATTPAVVELFSGWMGWILAMVVINVAPRIALAARHNPVLGVTALVGDGFVCGLVLAPVLSIATIYAPGAIEGALPRSEAQQRLKLESPARVGVGDNARTSRRAQRLRCLSNHSIMARSACSANAPLKP